MKTNIHFLSYHIISYHIISYHIISYHIISYHIISYHIISYHIISYRIISYLISYHIISYRIIYHVSYLIISFLLRMRNVSDLSCRGNQNTHFGFSNFFSKIIAVREKMLKNIVERCKPQMKIWRMLMLITCWIPKATNTHTQVV